MNGKIIEVVIFKVKNGVSEKQLFELSDAFGAALKREADGFIKRSLTKDCHKDRWVELIWWKSMEAVQAALENAPQMDEFKQYCSALEADDSEMFHLEEKA